MKNFFKDLGLRLLSKGFWGAFLLGAVPLIAQGLGYDLPGHYDDVINWILGLLVTGGLLHNPDPRSKKAKEHWLKNI